MNFEPFKKAENDFLLLKGQLATGRISREEFDTALGKLKVRDAYGRDWKLTPEDGKWLVRQDNLWVPGDPAEPSAGSASEHSGTSIPSGSGPTWLPLAALGIVVVLCISAVVGFLLLNAFGVLSVSLNLGRTPTATNVAAVASTGTPGPVGSLTGSAAQRTPVSTLLMASITPQATASPIPTETLPPFEPTQELATTYTALDADFFADECPLFEGSNETRDYGCDLGEYYMLHKQATTRYSYYDSEFQDAVIEAQGYWIEGPGRHEYGIVFRANTEGTLYYVFTVRDDGQYNVSLYKDEAYTDLIPYTKSELVYTGDIPNRLKVIARGDQFEIFLNDQKIGDVTDDSIPRGVAGLFFYNNEPNVEIGFDEFTISTFTPLTPTATPQVQLIETAPAVAPGVYVSGLRFSPGAPRRIQPVTFVVSFLNTTGRAQGFNWSVEIWEQDTSKRNSFGIANGRAGTVPAGTTDLVTADNWKVGGGGGCLPLRARVIYEDDQSRRIPFKSPNGSELWVPFQVCP